MRNYRELGRNVLAGAAIMGATIGGVGEKSVDAGIHNGIYFHSKLDTAGPQILFPEVAAQIPSNEIKILRKIFPTNITLNTAKIEKAEIVPVNSKRLDNGMITFPTPDSGIASQADMWGNFQNKIWIYGHSRFGGKEQLFHGLENVEKGDEILIDGINVDTSERYQGLKFNIDKMYIADRKAVAEIIFNSPAPDEPTIYLLTSFREEGRSPNDFLLDIEKLYSQVEPKFVEDPDDPKNYIYLLITATFPPPEEMLR